MITPRYITKNESICYIQDYLMSTADYIDMTHDQYSTVINAIFAGIPLPSIHVDITDIDTPKVQHNHRLTDAIVHYLSDRNPISSDNTQLDNKLFSQLPRSAQRQFLQRPLTVHQQVTATDMDLTVFFSAISDRDNR